MDITSNKYEYRHINSGPTCPNICPRFPVLGVLNKLSKEFYSKTTLKFNLLT